MRFSQPLPAVALALVLLAGLLGGCDVPGMGAAATPTPAATITDLDRARTALNAYFDALFEGRYADAVHLYGGSYKPLTDLNVSTAPEDHAELLQRGCTVNGFQCMRIKTVVQEANPEADTFAFTIEFQDRDGNLFAHDGTSQYPYTVEKFNDTFLVQELPVYVP
jgi:hypothetical protein